MNSKGSGGAGQFGIVDDDRFFEVGEASEVKQLHAPDRAPAAHNSGAAGNGRLTIRWAAGVEP
jgi:hypothetical protein